MLTPRPISCPSCGSHVTRVLASWRGGLRLVRCDGCVATSLDDRLLRARAKRRAIAARLAQQAAATNIAATVSDPSWP